MKIIKQELEFEECLKQRLEFICEFSKVTTIFVNGSIRKLEKTNLTYTDDYLENCFVFQKHVLNRQDLVCAFFKSIYCNNFTFMII